MIVRVIKIAFFCLRFPRSKIRHPSFIGFSLCVPSSVEFNENNRDGNDKVLVWMIFCKVKAVMCRKKTLLVW